MYLVKDVEAERKVSQASSHVMMVYNTDDYPADEPWKFLN
jgi:hypothetical protein